MNKKEKKMVLRFLWLKVHEQDWVSRVHLRLHGRVPPDSCNFFEYFLSSRSNGGHLTVMCTTSSAIRLAAVYGLQDKKRVDRDLVPQCPREQDPEATDDDMAGRQHPLSEG